MPANALSGSQYSQHTPNTDTPPLRFVVADTSIGISADERKKLFDAFSQAHGTITRRFGHTGLGLAISKRIAIATGGSIDIASTGGVGRVPPQPLFIDDHRTH